MKNKKRERCGKIRPLAGYGIKGMKTPPFNSYGQVTEKWGCVVEWWRGEGEELRLEGGERGTILGGGEVHKKKEI